MRKDTLENIQNILDSKGINITLIGEYVNQRVPLKCKCNLCGSEWSSTATNLKKWKGAACKLCTKGSITSLNDLQERLTSLNKKITVIAESTEKYKYTVSCDVCKRVWDTGFHNLKANGCAQCSRKLKGSLEKVQELVEKKNISVSGVYKNAYSKLNCVCKSCGEQWESTAHNLNYHGCPFCCFKGRIPKDKPTYLYYVRIENNFRTYWKIGITTKSDVMERFQKSKGLAKITLLYSFLFSDGEQAYLAERNILRLYKQFLNTDEVILSDGNTEIFLKDVLQMNHLANEEEQCQR